MNHKKFPYAGFNSAAIHAGHEKDPKYSHLTPVYAASTFVFDTAEQGMKRFSGQEEGFIYSRWGNPTFAEVEQKIAALETWGHAGLTAKAFLCASGMGAISALLLSTLKKGDKVLTHYSLYGGTQDMIESVLPDLGIEAIIVDLKDLQKAEDAFKNNKDIALLYLETPANPTLQCVDLAALTALAHQYGVRVACDNTFATPYLQQPFSFGVDFIVHSTTKFLNGHGTAIGGAFLGRDTEFMQSKAYRIYKNLGANGNPFDAFLLNNGMKTLPLRMDKHCSNAATIAEYLNKHPKIGKVNYCGLPGHPDFSLAQKQMKHAGAVLSFELKAGFEGGKKMMDQLKMCTRAVSLGTCDTLLCHPASMTHFSVPKEKKEAYGITDGLIRMSVGIEDVNDILNDLEQAIN
ncbi:trans-sulfuration enzyme family protein [Gynurincola endophyticus]|uniref:trans-sulfuration enzyme family protein n=1 Tax=Gynurincola endophyticus TaxID=2479004 RepID=UPI000F8CFC6C|nr:aminotransferase class I/II-fold pyridoxal phosphate-dependent enzyme [Gynurincola endophyticus]